MLTCVMHERAADANFREQEANVLVLSPKTQAEEAIAAAAVAASSVKLICTVSVGSNKILAKSVGIVNMGQIIVKAVEDKVL